MGPSGFWHCSSLDCILHWNFLRYKFQMETDVIRDHIAPVFYPENLLEQTFEKQNYDELSVSWN